MDWISLTLALCMGIALSAACGLRVFLPLLMLALAGRWGLAPLPEGMPWLYSNAALICLAAATTIELAGYYIPVVDNALDAIQAPLTLVAGVLVMSGMLAEQPDWLQWGVGIIGGAGTAGAVRGLTGALRLGSTAGTAGFGNWILATLENICAFVGALLALFAPLFAVLGLLLLGYAALRLVRRLRRRPTCVETDN